jgi:hypothetical protein
MDRQSQGREGHRLWNIGGSFPAAQNIGKQLRRKLLYTVEYKCLIVVTRDDRVTEGVLANRDGHRD